MEVNPAHLKTAMNRAGSAVAVGPLVVFVDRVGMTDNEHSEDAVT
jgi:hypothetical protein